MNDMTPPAGPGHNYPPPYDPDILADLVGRTDEFMSTSTRIRRDFNPIRTEEHAQLLTDHISGLRGLKKQVDTARVTAKKPHDDAAKAVQAAFTPVLDRIGKATDAMLAMQGEYMSHKADQERKRKAQEAAAAAATKAEADRLAAEAAKTGDLDAEAKAEAKAKEAEALAKQAAKEVKVSATSATGAGRTVTMVKIREAKITNINLLFVHYRARPEVVDLLTRLVNADIRSREVDESQIPGIEIMEREVPR
ncbi:hypothetical protein [Pseudogemmobacter sonorensis]|uniref:hypothetical protein n=1 Tax=Pseudogemmobacter sonorensis TaxID=2989681 RepID=UPI0036A09999